MISDEQLFDWIVASNDEAHGLEIRRRCAEIAKPLRDGPYRDEASRREVLDSLAASLRTRAIGASQRA